MRWWSEDNRKAAALSDMEKIDMALDLTNKFDKKGASSFLRPRSLFTRFVER